MNAARDYVPRRGNRSGGALTPPWEAQCLLARRSLGLMWVDQRSVPKLSLTDCAPPGRRKLEIPNLKSETNSRSQAPMTETHCRALPCLEFGILSLRICFGFRASDFEFEIVLSVARTFTP